MAKIYVAKWRKGTERGTEVFHNHMPRTGTFWMLDECLVSEAETTGKHWSYDRKSRKLIAQPPKLKALPAPAQTKLKQVAKS